MGLSLAPLGAFLAVTAQFNVLPILFSIAVLFWVGGFDIIYSLQDQSFDKEQKLHSVPVWLGKKQALYLSKVFHFITFSHYYIQQSFMISETYIGSDYLFFQYY